MIASLPQSVLHVGKDMLRLATCQLDYADDKHKDQGKDHGVLYEALAVFAPAKLMDFSRQDVVSS